VRTADGLVVEASVVARLLRIRLLAIDARVVVSPARVTGRRRAGPIGVRLATAERLIDEGAASLAASRALARSPLPPITPRRRSADGREAAA
jgi:hypothetical protein